MLLRHCNQGNGRRGEEKEGKGRRGERRRGGGGGGGRKGGGREGRGVKGGGNKNRIKFRALEMMYLLTQHSMSIRVVWLT